MLTLKELAKMCEVSPSTVSNILNGKSNVGESTRKRVLKVIEETGYQRNYFASSIRKSKSMIIGIIVEDLAQFTTTDIVESIMSKCDDAGYRTVLVNMRMYDRFQNTWYDDEKILEDNVRPALQELESIHVDGTIYVAGHDRVLHCFPKSYSTKTVIAYATSEHGRFPSILMDDERGGYEVGSYLLSMGHRKIGVITGDLENTHAQRRLKGYQKSLFEAGIPYNPSMTYQGNWKRKSGYDAAKKLIAEGVSAIWAMNDEMAGGVYLYVDEAGMRVGKDISVVGYDNRVLSEYLLPGLTTNELPLKEIGLRAAETLLDMLKVETESVHYDTILVPAHMIRRGSVAAV